MGSRLDKNSGAVRKRIERHNFSDEGGDEYEASAFGGFKDYFRRKKIKLQNLDVELRQGSGKPQIFKGVVAHVSGFTQPPLHVLHKQLVEHGAAFLQYLDAKTMATHIIASSLTPKKAIEFKNYRIVKPAWVVDSIAVAKMLPWSDYRVIDEGPRQRIIGFDDGKLSSQATTPQKGYRDQIQNSFYTSQFRSPASPANRLGTSSAFQGATPSKYTPSRLQPVEGIDDDDDDCEADISQISRAAPQPSIPTPPRVQISDSVTELMPVDIQKLQADASTALPPPQDPSKRSMTSEEHNAWLLSDPKIRKSSTANPEFLKQYYSESRLHHLSTWKAELKSRMQKLANEMGTKPIKRRPGARRYIMHVDFDSFFCTVSLKSAPEYVDKPAVVAHSTGTGSEIASCNYPARKHGIKNGMWMKRALELCSDIKVLPYDFPAYEDASRRFYEAILEVGGVVQSVSIDEALVDVTALVLSASGSDGRGVSEGSVWREQAKADEIATDLRARIKDKTGCHVSVGIGGNILLAKVALRRAKPAGQYQITPEEVLEFLGELRVEDLPGVAYSIGGKLEEIGIRLVKDIRDTSRERLVSVLGPKTGEKLWEYARGVDRAEVGDQPIRKSVSAEVNWGIRFLNQPEAEEFVMNLSKELEKRLLNEGVKGRHLTMKIMRRCLDAPLDPAKHLGHGKCDTFNKSTVFRVATHNGEAIGKEAVSILRSYKFNAGDLRGLGVQMQKLEPINPSAAPEGSQRRLDFGAPRVGPPSKGADEISDFEGPERVAKTSLQFIREVSADPISEDPVTPRKPKHTGIHPALALARSNEADDKANTPLNMMGTQFIMPSNPDAAVLAELPQDIRSRLMAQQKRRESHVAVSRENSSALIGETVIPPDIDPEVFHALPEDVKAEVLASYGLQQQQQRERNPPPALPQSPRKDRTMNCPQPRSSPSKRGRPRGSVRGMLSRARERQRDEKSGLMQTSFVTGREDISNHNHNRAAQDGEIEELDPAFLAELPEEVRREVIDDHRRRKLAQRSGLGLSLHRRGAGHRGREIGAAGGSGQTKIAFPTRPPKVTFTATSLTTLQEVKDMLSAWHRETKEEGPHDADVKVFETYLARVVTEERDMEKAKKLVRWLSWVIDEDEDDPDGEKISRGRKGWEQAVVGIKAAVQRALHDRGLGPMVL